MQIIPVSNSKHIVNAILTYIDYEVIDISKNFFQDSQLNISVNGNIGNEVIIIGSISKPVNDSLMEILFLANACKRANAKVTAIIPYLGYSRQDKADSNFAMKLIAKMIESAGIERIITLDLHSSQIAGFFNIVCDNIVTHNLFVPFLEKGSVLVAPDIGSVPRIRKYSEKFGSEVAIINKIRTNKSCYATHLIGDVKGKSCFIIDDIIDSANTICVASEKLFELGAEKISVIATHPVLSGNAIDRIQKSHLDKIYVSDSIYHKSLPSKFNILSTAKMISELKCFTQH